MDEIIWFSLQRVYRGKCLEWDNKRPFGRRNLCLLLGTKGSSAALHHESLACLPRPSFFRPWATVRYLPDQFFQNCFGEIFAVFGFDDERAGAAGDRSFEVLGQVGHARPVDGQRVDDDALPDDGIAHILDRLTHGVGTVAGQIDHPPRTLELVGFDRGGGEDQRFAHRVAAETKISIAGENAPAEGLR